MDDERSWSFDNGTAGGSVTIVGDNISYSVEDGRMGGYNETCTLAEYMDEKPRTDGWSTKRQFIRDVAPEISDEVEQEAYRRLGREMPPPLPGS